MDRTCNSSSEEPETGRLPEARSGQLGIRMKLFQNHWEKKSPVSVPQNWINQEQLYSPTIPALRMWRQIRSSRASLTALWIWSQPGLLVSKKQNNIELYRFTVLFCFHGFRSSHDNSFFFHAGTGHGNWNRMLDICCVRLWPFTEVAVMSRAESSS